MRKPRLFVTLSMTNEDLPTSAEKHESFNTDFSRAYRPTVTVVALVVATEVVMEVAMAVNTVGVTETMIRTEAAIAQGWGGK